ncbi:MAG: hypothetical protein IJ191_05335 [Treponema sp.]|nr:hypothetical protein [Treponema sp.]
MAHRIETDAGKNTYYVTNTDGDVMWSNLTRREAEHLCSVMTEEAPEEWWDIFDAEVTPYE